MPRQTMSRVARSPRGIVVEHEAGAGLVEQIAAGAAQALLEHRAGHPRAGAGEQPGRVELHHLHVTERQPCAQRHRHAVARLVAGRRVVEVHGRAAAGGEQCGAGAHHQRLAGPHVEHVHAAQARLVRRRNQVERAVILQPPHVAAPDLLGQPVDDLDAGEIALVHGAVEGLTGERLLVNRAVRIAVEEAADLVLQLADADRRGRDQQPRQLLLVEPAAAVDGVHEMPLDGILRRQRDVVAALHHAGAAAFAEQALHRDGDVELRPRLLGVQRREQPGAAGAEDQDVGVEGLHDTPLS